MKNIFISALLVMLMGMAPSLYAQNLQGVYANLSIATTSTDGANVDGISVESDSGISIVATGGFQMKNVHEYFSVEGEFTAPISKPEFSTSASTVTGSGDLSFFTIAGYGVLSYPLSEVFALKGRLGFVYWDAELDFTARNRFSSSTTSVSADDSGTELSFGFGATYSVTDRIALLVEYTNLGDWDDIDSVTNWSGGVRYKF